MAGSRRRVRADALCGSTRRTPLPGLHRIDSVMTQAFQNKNVGKKPFVFYTVNIKDAKK